jgi:hypothetical protein
MGDGSILSPSLGTSFLLTAGGVASLYFSGVLPSPADSILKGLGIAAAAWGGYNLATQLFGGSGPQIDRKAKAEAPPTPTMSPGALAKVSGQIITPLTNTIPPLQAELFGPMYFEIKVLWRNDSAEEANFKYNILAESVSAPGAWIPGQTSLSRIIDDSAVEGLGKGTESGAIPLRVELFQPPQPGSIAKVYGVESTYKIYLQLQKLTPSGPEPTGEAVVFGPFDYK